MDDRQPLGALLVAAQQTAAEVRTLGDYTKAQMIVALQAELAVTPRFGRDLMARRIADYFCAEVWRLALH